MVFVSKGSYMLNVDKHKIAEKLKRNSPSQIYWSFSCCTLLLLWHMLRLCIQSQSATIYQNNYINFNKKYCDEIAVCRTLESLCYFSEKNQYMIIHISNSTQTETADAVELLSLKISRHKRLHPHLPSQPTAHNHSHSPQPTLRQQQQLRLLFTVDALQSLLSVVVD